MTVTWTGLTNTQDIRKSKLGFCFVLFYERIPRDGDIFRDLTEFMVLSANRSRFQLAKEVDGIGVVRVLLEELGYWGYILRDCYLAFFPHC